MKRLIIILCLFSAVNASASFFYKDLEFLDMENFEVEREEGTIYIRFDYVIFNPNWYNVMIMPSSLYLTLAGTDCGWVKIEDKIKIKKKTKGHYPFVLKGDSGDFVKSTFASIWSLMTGKGIDFNISGKIKAGIFIFRKKWAMDYTYKMSFDEFLSFF